MIAMSLGVEGLAEANSTIKILHAICDGSLVQAVNLLGKVRSDVQVKTRKKSGRHFIQGKGRTVKGGMTNADLLEWHAKKQKRDFREPGGQENKIGAAFIKKAIDSIPRKKVMKNYTGSKQVGALVKALASRTPNATESKLANNLVSGGFREMMKEYMKIVSTNIDRGKFTGGGSKKLNEKYEDFKKYAVGFAYPIDKFTGQIIDNLNAKGPNARNIKLIRGKKR